MKRPYLDQYQRLAIYNDTTLGALCMLDLRWMQFLRPINRVIYPFVEKLANQLNKLTK